MRIRGSLVVAALIFAAVSAPRASGQGVSFSKPGWPAVHGPFSWADYVMNTNTISRSGGIYQLRKNTLDVFTPTFSIERFDASGLDARPLNTDFFSYALGSQMYEDAARLLFADGLYSPSDTLDYLQGVVSYDIHDFSRAAECFARIPEGSPYYSQASGFLDVWTSTPVLTDFKRKSPLLAASMSAVIPGSGKIYAGDLRSGVSTFLVVGALGAMMAESAHKLGWQDWRTIALTSVFGVFYIGNIYGSAVSVSVIKSTYEDAQKAGLLFDLHIPLHQF
ncbi:MAG: hypothetical protein K6A64_05740 [Bacteroidales bacterium]|nr:hypothetical protein [Bacteroidales bacterium]